MKDYPLIKFVTAFVIGLVATSFFYLPAIYLLISLAVMMILTILFYFSKSDKLKIISNVSAIITIVIFGMCYLTLSKSNPPQYPFKDKFIRNVLLDGVVKEIDLPSNKLTLELEIKKTVLNNQIEDVSYNVLCNLHYRTEEINKILKKLRPGNHIVVLGDLSIPPNERNPGEFDYRKYLSDKGISVLFNSYSSFDFVIVDYNENIISSSIFSIRYTISKMIKSMYSPKTAGLLKGLLLADRSEIGYDVKEGFIKSGVIHVLAVSGLHVGFIVLILVFLFGRLNIYLRISLTIAGLLLFMVITGLSPSVVRATIMAILLLISYIRSNKQNNYNTLSLAALIILTFDPNQVFNPGFQLSFSAVISIFVFYPRFKSIIETHLNPGKFVRFILLFFAVSLSAQLGTIPFTIYYFGKLSLISLFSNLIIIPAIGIIICVGITTLALSIVSVSLGSLLVLFNEWVVDLIFRLIDTLSSLSFSHLTISNYSVWDGVLYLLVLAFFVINYKVFISFRSRIIFSLLIVGNLILWSKIDNQKLMPDGRLSAMIVDAGQSEATILKFPDGKTAMINFGSASGDYSFASNKIIPLLNKLEINHIDYGIISHLNRNKYLGILELFEKGMIDTIFIPKASGYHKEDSLFIAYLDQGKANYKIIDHNKLAIGNSRLYFLSQILQSDYNYFDIMNKSAPLKIQFGQTSLLFLGGLEKRGEELIIDAYQSFLKSDILHIANYGSNVSTSSRLLNTVDPSYAIINVGSGNYLNYPSQNTIERIIRSKSIPLRTDEEGALLFVSDGSKITEINWRDN